MYLIKAAESDTVEEKLLAAQEELDVEDTARIRSQFPLSLQVSWKHPHYLGDDGSGLGGAMVSI